MSIIQKIALTINVLAVVYFAFMAGMRYKERRDASRAIYEAGGGDQRKAEILAKAIDKAKEPRDQQKENE